MSNNLNTYSRGWRECHKQRINFSAVIGVIILICIWAGMVLVARDMYRKAHPVAAAYSIKA